MAGQPGSVVLGSDPDFPLEQAPEEIARGRANDGGVAFRDSRGIRFS
jgi:hypothetical protein